MSHLRAKLLFTPYLFFRSGKHIVRLGFLLLLLGLITGAVEAAEIRGKVQSVGGKPIADAVVSHRESGAKTTTSEDGSFLLNAEAKGRFVLEVVHPDYVDGLFSSRPNRSPTRSC